MNFRLLLKFLALFLVFVLLLAPIGEVRDLIRERQTTRDQVVQEIARGAGYAQTITGPILLVPYVKKVQVKIEAVGDKPARIEEQEVKGELAFLPNTLEVGSDVSLSERERGIYKARIYKTDNVLTGAFVLPAHFGITESITDYTFGAPSLAVGISDVRGIANGLSLQISDKPIPFEPGTKTALLPAGVHAELNLGASPSQQVLPFSIQLGLHGTADFQVVPVGRDTKVHIRSNWPHPSFVGEFLPLERQIGKAGFDARWQTSFFATNLDDAMARCHSERSDEACQQFHLRKFGVSFVDPVDQYLKSERATKYALLFLGLTFAALFLVEALRGKSVHPIQYGLVGLALAVFFLLLLSLSEHFGFGRAYLVSAIACVGLISAYAAHLLGSLGLTAFFSAALSGLYGMLYLILSAEDYALLAGSLLVFSVLGAVMMLSRKVDWGAFGQGVASRAKAPAELNALG